MKAGNEAKDEVDFGRYVLPKSLPKKKPTKKTKNQETEMLNLDVRDTSEISDHSKPGDQDVTDFYGSNLPSAIPSKSNEKKGKKQVVKDLDKPPHAVKAVTAVTCENLPINNNRERIDKENAIKELIEIFDNDNNDIFEDKSFPEENSDTDIEEKMIIPSQHIPVSLSLNLFDKESTDVPLPENQVGFKISGKKGREKLLHDPGVIPDTAQNSNDSSLPTYIRKKIRNRGRQGIFGKLNLKGSYELYNKANTEVGYLENEDDTTSLTSYGMLGEEVQDLYTYWFTQQDEHRVWCDSDIGTDEVLLYKNRLELLCRKPATISQELFTNCRLDFPHRTKILCQHIENKMLSLTSTLLCGTMSETALHVAILYGSTDTALTLMECGGSDLILKQYTDRQYEGATALHLAVVKGNGDLIAPMLSYLSPANKDLLLHTQAKGAFFVKKLKASGLPLSLAAWTANAAIFDALLYAGANLIAKDLKTHNTVLHTLVRYAVPHPEVATQMMHHVLYSGATQYWWQQKQELSSEEMTKNQIAAMHNNVLRQENLQGETPLTMATRLCALEAFKTIVQTEKVYRYPQWEYGPAAYTFYEMSEFDTAIQPHGKESILMMLTGDLNDENLDFFRTEPIKSLVEAKWKTYRFLFFGWALIHIVLMTAFSVYGIKKKSHSVFLNESMNESTDTCSVAGAYEFYSETNYFMLFTLIALVYAITGLVTVTWNIIANAFQYYVKKGFKIQNIFEIVSKCLGPYRIMSLIFCFLTILWFVMKVCGHSHDNIILSIALVLGWTLVLYFSHAFESAGIFSTMMYRMVAENFPPFLSTFLIFNVAYSVAFQCIIEDKYKDDIFTTSQTIFYFSQFIVGVAQDDIVQFSHYRIYSQLLLLSFIVLCNIKLINMLIAALTDTYASVTHKKKCLWLKKRTDGILTIERMIPSCFKVTKYLQKRYMYQTKDGPCIYYLPKEEIMASEFKPSNDSNRFKSQGISTEKIHVPN